MIHIINKKAIILRISMIIAFSNYKAVNNAINS